MVRNFASLTVLLTCQWIFSQNVFLYACQRYTIFIFHWERECNLTFLFGESYLELPFLHAVVSLQVCVWCWHHIIDMAEKDDSEGRCPACRTIYEKEKIVAKQANCERLICIYAFHPSLSTKIEFCSGLNSASYLFYDTGQCRKFLIGKPNHQRPSQRPLK